MMFSGQWTVNSGQKKYRDGVLSTKIKIKNSRIDPDSYRDRYGYFNK